LVDLGYKKQFRVRHGNDEFATDKSHINGIVTQGSHWIFLGATPKPD